jgi:hypothetical protein
MVHTLIVPWLNSPAVFKSAEIWFLFARHDDLHNTHRQISAAIEPRWFLRCLERLPQFDAANSESGNVWRQG